MEHTQSPPPEPYSNLPEHYPNVPEPYTYPNPYAPPYVPPTETYKPEELDGSGPGIGSGDPLPVANERKWWKRYGVLLAVLAVVIVGGAVGGGVGGALASQKKNSKSVPVLGMETGTTAGAAGYVCLLQLLEINGDMLRKGLFGMNRLRICV
jgi:hypothetical protein